eukprot:GEMP01041660.1.p1 GENE.GEMP01041660.1~~GEMP01041660.1.p1  ORF type:complete len:294 (+),score=68.05 GEMP01041660.1:23-904(+)
MVSKTRKELDIIHTGYQEYRALHKPPPPDYISCCPHDSSPRRQRGKTMENVLPRQKHTGTTEHRTNAGFDLCACRRVDDLREEDETGKRRLEKELDLRHDSRVHGSTAHDTPHPPAALISHGGDLPLRAPRQSGRAHHASGVHRAGFVNSLPLLEGQSPRNASKQRTPVNHGPTSCQPETFQPCWVTAEEHNHMAAPHEHVCTTARFPAPRAPQHALGDTVAPSAVPVAPSSVNNSRDIDKKVPCKRRDARVSGDGFPRGCTNQKTTSAVNTCRDLVWRNSKNTLEVHSPAKL